MTISKQDFIQYWTTPDEDGRTALDHFEESLGEEVTQYQSEKALYGDANPGQGSKITERCAELAEVRRRLNKIHLEK